MAEFVVGGAVPVVSVLIGAAITYWLNVRARRRNHVEDLFNEAITAVAVADAARYYIWNVAKPKLLDDAEHKEVLRVLARALPRATREPPEKRVLPLPGCFSTSPP